VYGGGARAQAPPRSLSWIWYGESGTIRPDRTFRQKPVAWNLDQICFKELHVMSSNASVPSAWDGALAAVGAGLWSGTRPIVSKVFPNNAAWR